jgi:hypothetical protein
MVRAHAAWLVSFALVVYLGLSDGGYDLLVWGEVGVVAWLLVGLGALVGLLPVKSLYKSGWLATAALIGLTAWTALGISWAESSERAVMELARTSTYLGVFLLALSAARSGQARGLLNGVTAGVVLVGLIALLSRLRPAWFPADPGTPLLGERNRLDYPLNYFDALAALLALGWTLAVGAATRARTQAGAMLAASVLPALGLALFLTLARGGLVELVVGLGFLLALSSDRAAKLATALLGGAGAGVLIFVAEQQPALEAGARDAAARHQGNLMLAFVIVVCVAVGLGHAALRRTGPPEWLRLPTPSSRAAVAVATSSLVLVVAAFVVLGGPGEVSQRWREFKAPTVQLRGQAQYGPTRFTSVSSRGRYQIWRSSLDAVGSAPIGGIGPGSFEYWWTRKPRLSLRFHDAHSLYFNSLAELGIVGLLLVAALLYGVFATGARRAVRERDIRPVIAAATAGCAVFAVSAGFEWVWNVPVLPAAFLVLAAIAVDGRERHRRPSWRALPRARLAFGALSIAALVAIVPPLVGTAYVRSSESRVQAGRPASALDDARTAERIQPYAATPKLQQALVYEGLGSFGRAARLARSAIRAESTNWQPWLILSRIEARRGHARTSLRAYRKARSLNPGSRLFTPSRVTPTQRR